MVVKYGDADFVSANGGVFRGEWSSTWFFPLFFLLESGRTVEGQKEDGRMTKGERWWEDEAEPLPSSTPVVLV